MATHQGPITVWKYIFPFSQLFLSPYVAVMANSLVVEIDFIPDVSQYPANCLFNTQLTLPNGQPAQFYDSSCQGVVDLHFKWMQQYGIDGVIVQRFIQSINDQSFITVSICSLRCKSQTQIYLTPNLGPESSPSSS